MDIFREVANVYSQKDMNAKRISTMHGKNLLCNFDPRPREGWKPVEQNCTQVQELEESNFPELSKIERVSDKPQEDPKTLEQCFFIVNAASVLEQPTADQDKNNKPKKTQQNKEQTDMYCLLCCSEVPGKNGIATHISGKRHQTACKKFGSNRISFVDEGIYYCSGCNIVCNDLNNVVRHIRSDTHLNRFRRVKHEQDFFAEENKSFEAANEKPACLYIVKRNAKRAFCQICDPVTEHPISTKNMRDHASTPFHKMALIRYGCNNIVAKEGGAFYCECCKFEIADLQHLFIHIKEKSHHSSLPKTYGQDDTPSKSSFLEWVNSIKNDLHQDEWSQGNLNLTTDVNNWRLTKSQYYCNVCKTPASDSMFLHVHMASHIVEEIHKLKRSKEDRSVENKSTVNHSVLGEVHRVGELEQAALDIAPKVELQSGTKLTNENGCIGFSDPSEISQEKIITECNIKILNFQYEERPLKMNVKGTLALLDFNHDEIYDLSDKLNQIKLGIKLSLVTDTYKIYCLICKCVVDYFVENYHQHLWSTIHCVYFEEMENDHARFENFPEQYSDLRLAQDYMQEVSDDIVHCLICDEEIPNEDRVLEDHIYSDGHNLILEDRRSIVNNRFEEINSRMHCDWYDVAKYWCVVCHEYTNSEVQFIRHLGSKHHNEILKNPENAGKKMIYDFCPTCALFWYGYRYTYGFHTETDHHVWLKQDGHFFRPELPQLAKDLFTSPELFVEEKIAYLETMSQSERAKNKQIITDLESTVRTKFPRAKAYVYGSRASGLALPESNVNIYLDCRDLYNGSTPKDSHILYFANGTYHALSKSSTMWDVKSFSTNQTSPIIQIIHRATELHCVISLENGLSVENTALLKAYNEAFPMCQWLSLFIKLWLVCCGFSGYGRISHDVLHWLVVFYFQIELILPSVESVISASKKSRVIAGWEVGVNRDITYNTNLANLPPKEFLTRFFTFYANFDFRRQVVCPFTGEAVNKRVFLDLDGLPEGMKRYAERIADKKDFLRVDSPMCLQDPLDHCKNLTESVTKVHLNRFRKYCSKSLDLLYS